MLISVFSVFQIVKFKNEACTTSTGEMGTCYTESECTAAGGEASGSCASSFGTCCLCESPQLAVIHSSLSSQRNDIIKSRINN